MAGSSTSPRYGDVNLDLIRGWFTMPAEDDGPFWAINLMKYRKVADYQDGRETAISGKEADDAYVPRGPLQAIGAMIVMGADVVAQGGAGPEWDRIGIVRYPSRAGFLAMQNRDDFKAQHVHKDAGMEFTIVMSCLAEPGRPAVVTPEGTIVMRVARLSDGSSLPEVDGAVRLASFTVEGVIVGDDRTWTHVAFDCAEDGFARDRLMAATGTAEEHFALTLGAPALDALEESVRTAPDVPRRQV